MLLDTRDFNTLVADQAAAIQAQANGIFAFDPGDVLLALVESNAGVALWIQELLLNLLAVTRLNTSTGTDVDSFLADFGLTRLPAQAASGLVTFSRFTNTQQAVVPIGAQIETIDGQEVFIVIVDTLNENYNPSLGGYVIASGINSINVPVLAITPGSAGNVVINAVTVLLSPIPFVDTVTNPAPFTNGTDAQTDPQAQQYFRDYLASLAKADYAAIKFAVESVEGVKSYLIVENKNFDTGDDYFGFFYVIVDDGSGSPSSNLIAAVLNAVDSVRGLSIRIAVYGPTVVTANVVADITISNLYDADTLVANAITTLTTYIDTLPIGTNLPITRIAQVIFDSSPGITNVTNVEINSSTSDLAVTNKQIIKAGAVAIVNVT